MNVDFEPLPNCLANLKIEVDAPDVEKKMGEITSQYTKLARLPGFRQGKAPRAVVEKKFNKEIREEVTKQVLSDACRTAITDRKLRVLSLAEVEDVEWGEDKSLADVSVRSALGALSAPPHIETMTNISDVAVIPARTSPQMLLVSGERVSYIAFTVAAGTPPVRP